MTHFEKTDHSQFFFFFGIRIHEEHNYPGTKLQIGSWLDIKVGVRFNEVTLVHSNMVADLPQTFSLWMYYLLSVQPWICHGDYQIIVDCKQFHLRLPSGLIGTRPHHFFHWYGGCETSTHHQTCPVDRERVIVSWNKIWKKFTDTTIYPCTTNLLTSARGQFSHSGSQTMHYYYVSAGFIHLPSTSLPFNVFQPRLLPRKCFGFYLQVVWLIVVSL